MLPVYLTAADNFQLEAHMHTCTVTVVWEPGPSECPVATFALFSVHVWPVVRSATDCAEAAFCDGQQAECPASTLLGPSTECR